MEMEDSVWFRNFSCSSGEAASDEDAALAILLGDIFVFARVAWVGRWCRKCVEGGEACATL